MNVLVVGGAGHIGTVLVPMLLERGHEVTVLDTYWFWSSEREYAAAVEKSLPAGHSFSLNLLRNGDIRDSDAVYAAMNGIDAVIHLACLSNDPSAELDTAFTYNVNYDGSKIVIDEAVKKKIKRFVYASSSSVYGIKEGDVTEETEPNPLTQYSILKLKVEQYLQSVSLPCWTIIRPSTVCGPSPRMRIDLVVNIMTYNAVKKGKIVVFGGEQKRPLIHIKDISRLYCDLLEAPVELINQKIFNAGTDNLTLNQIAHLVRDVVRDELGREVPIEVQSTNDNRSYHVSSKKIKEELNFVPTYSISEAVKDLVRFYNNSSEDFEADKNYNIKTMKKVIGQ
jgi:nucleoside-diphosphate-sugar epimerase